MYKIAILLIFTLTTLVLSAERTRDRDYRERLYERYAPNHRVYRYNPYDDPYSYYFGQPDLGYYRDLEEGPYQRGRLPVIILEAR